MAYNTEIKFPPVAHNHDSTYALKDHSHGNYLYSGQDTNFLFAGFVKEFQSRTFAPHTEVSGIKEGFSCHYGYRPLLWSISWIPRYLNLVYVNLEFDNVTCTIENHSDYEVTSSFSLYILEVANFFTI